MGEQPETVPDGGAVADPASSKGGTPEEGAAPALERVVIQIPEDVKPGVTEVEVDISETKVLRVRVPEQAQPHDRLALDPLPHGEWRVSILPRPRELTILVPDGTEAGKTQLSVDVGGGEKIKVVAPECARPGDELTFSENVAGEWSCRLRQRPRPAAGPPGGGACGGSSCSVARKPQARVQPCDVSCYVPANAVPGETRLRIAVGEAGHAVFTVPEAATAGDLLAVVVRADGSAVASVKRETASVDPGDGTTGSLGSKYSLTLTRIQADGDQLFKDLVAEVRAGGAFVSEKIQRGRAPPLDIAGMLAVAPLAANEDIARVPEHLFLSSRRCQQLLPELSAAVGALRAKMREREVEGLHAAVLAMALHEAEARHRGGGRSGVEAAVLAAEGGCDARASATCRVWARFADCLVCENFAEHPYWRFMDDPAGLRASLAPSFEAEYLGAMAGDVIAMHTCLEKYVPEHLFGGKLELGMFLQARLCILTRVFQLDGDSCMVPVNDCFNHSESPSAVWSWDDERREMVLTTVRAHRAGEEILISYGNRSNVLLYRTYGFTLPPEVEPDWTYFVRGGRPDDVFARFLPAQYAGHSIHFEVQLVQASLVVALNACKERGRDPEAFLRELCSQSMLLYEEDPQLTAPIQALRRSRQDGEAPDAVQQHAWWRHVAAAELPTGEREVNAVRVKMSEYLCLLAHLEILDVLDGALTEDRCLEKAAPVRKVLLQGFHILRSGARFELNTQEANMYSAKTLDLMS